jgi:hypothetical protein
MHGLCQILAANGIGLVDYHDIVVEWRAPRPDLPFGWSRKRLAILAGSGAIPAQVSLDDTRDAVTRRRKLR